MGYSLVHLCAKNYDSMAKFSKVIVRIRRVQFFMPHSLLTINRKSTGSIDELRIICQGLHTRTAVARHPCFSWAFLHTYIRLL